MSEDVRTCQLRRGYKHVDKTNSLLNGLFVCPKPVCSLHSCVGVFKSSNRARLSDRRRQATCAQVDICKIRLLRIRPRKYLNSKTYTVFVTRPVSSIKVGEGIAVPNAMPTPVLWPRFGVRDILPRRTAILAFWTRNLHMVASLRLCVPRQSRRILTSTIVVSCRPRLPSGQSDASGLDAKTLWNEVRNTARNCASYS